MNRSLIPLWILTLGFTFGLTSYFTFIKTFVGETRIGTVGLFFLTYSIASVGLRLFFSWLPERVGPKRAMLPAMASMVGGIFLLAHASSAFDIGMAGILCGLGHAFVFPIISAMVVNRAHADNRGVAMTLFTSLFDVGALAGAPLLGWVIEASSYSLMFSVAALVAAGFSLGFYLLDREVGAFGVTADSR